MRKVLVVEFAHEERRPDGFNAALGNFLGHVLTVGYRVVQKWVVDHGPTAQPKVEAPTVTFMSSTGKLAELADALLPDPTVEVPERFYGESVMEQIESEVAQKSEDAALALETATAVDGPEDAAPAKPPTLKELRAGIKALKAELGGNKILSQVEMAKKLGVSRDRIRKALK